MAMISICVFVAAVSVRVIQKKGDEKNTELKMESSDGLNMSEVSEREAFVEAQRSNGIVVFSGVGRLRKVFRHLKMQGRSDVGKSGCISAVCGWDRR